MVRAYMHSHCTLRAGHLAEVRWKSSFRSGLSQMTADPAQLYSTVSPTSRCLLNLPSYWDGEMLLSSSAVPPSLVFSRSGYRAIADLINTLIPYCRSSLCLTQYFPLLFWGEINVLSFFISLANCCFWVAYTWCFCNFLVYWEIVFLSLWTLTLAFTVIARERWWLCESVPDVWPRYNRAGADLSRAVKSSCGTVPETEKGRTQWPGGLFQPCVIFCVILCWIRRIISKDEIQKTGKKASVHRSLYISSWVNHFLTDFLFNCK